MKIIVDTSALVALYIPEKFSEIVKQKIEEADEYHFLDLTYYEFTNAIRKRVARKEIDENYAMKILNSGIEFLANSTVHEGKDLVKTAYEIGLKYNLTVYDASLIALANRINAPILTTDEKLLNAVKSTSLSSMFIQLA
ncbi:MAG: type II toxin-antitoxin system VapC family toxin [Sulfolobaceae archaeon]|nr:type II toxin-antitoxin system VapC family toxin [Sulfolobaceae archaeon]